MECGDAGVRIDVLLSLIHIQRLHLYSIIRKVLVSASYIDTLHQSWIDYSYILILRFRTTDTANEVSLFYRAGNCWC